MTHDEFRKLMHEVFDNCLAIQDKKGKDYAGTEDALRVFKQQGSDLNITPLQAWGVLADKGWNAIKTFAGTQKPGSEPLVQRVGDIINYSVFLLALAEEMGIDTGLGQSEPENLPSSDDFKLTPLGAGAKYPHKYPGRPGHNPNDPGDCYTSDCEYECGCWAGPSRSGGPDGVDPFGNCPKHPEYPATKMAAPRSATSPQEALEINPAYGLADPVPRKPEVAASKPPLEKVKSVWHPPKDAA